MQPEENCLKLTLRLMRIMGFMKEQTLFDKMKIYVSLLFAITVDVLIVIGIFSGNKKSLKVFADNFEGMGLFFQITSKVLIVLVYKDDLQDILVLRQKFWKYDKFGKEFEDEMRIYPKYMYSYIRTYLVVISSTLLAVTLKPFILHELPIPCWLPEGEFWFYAIALFEIELLFFGIYAGVLGFDTMFPLMCMETSMQFKMLNRAFSRMENQNDVRICVAHHTFLYEFINQVKRIHSAALFTRLVVFMPEASIQLLIIEDPNQVFANKLKAVLYILDMYMQLTYLCFPVGFLQNEMEESAVAVSTCAWYLKSGNFAKNLIPIIRRSQQMFSVKVWGLFDVGRMGFVNLCRFTFSVYTFLKTVK